MLALARSCSRTLSRALARSRSCFRPFSLAFALSLSPPLSLSLIYIYVYHLSRFPFAYLYQCLVFSPSVALYRFKLVWKLYLMLLEQHLLLVETVRIIVEWGASNMGHHLLPQPNGKVYVFISVGLYVYLDFFCLPVSKIAGKRMDGFSWNLQDILGKIQGTIWKIWGVVYLTHTYSFFYMFSRKSASANNITEKRMSGFFLGKSDMRQETLWNIFRILRLTT